jgi:hypothetical protein
MWLREPQTAEALAGLDQTLKGPSTPETNPFDRQGYG